MDRSKVVARRIACGVALALALTAPAHAQGRGGRGQQPEPEPLKRRFMGPSVGNRIAAVAGVPGDPSIYYAGAASGGVWKSTDSGATFIPVFDGQRVAAIGALAVAPTEPNTGLGRHRRSVGDSAAATSSGDGIYKSTDAGATWTRMGLDETGRIGRIIVHPTESEHRLRLRARAHDRPATGTGRVQDHRRRPHVESRALRRYEHRLLRPSMDAKNPERAVCRYLAGRNAPVGDAQRRARQRHPRDTRRRRDVDARDANGLPKSPRRQDRCRRCALRLQPRLRAHSDRRSGLALALGRWRAHVEGRQLGPRAHRPRRLLRADSAFRPSTPNEVLVANSSSHRSTDGGVTFQPWGGCGDCHDIWFDPKNADRFAMTDDAGMQITTEPRSDPPAHPAADRSDVSRRRRQSGAVLHLQQHAGQRDDARSEQLSGSRCKQRARREPARGRTGRGRWRRARRRGCAVGSRAWRL